MTSLFKQMWGVLNEGEFAKAERLTEKELRQIQETISTMQNKGIASEKIIAALQKAMPKLREKWRAERAFWTESKRSDTQKVGMAAEELDMNKYRVILSPNACHICREKTRNGARVFKSTDLQKTGYGHVPPFHPNCYCILIPTE
ncbi:MAG: hypothetical protein ACREHG_03825 [Candidatus Saccharimonadales bacterium]